jgi:hypothetical protein
MAGINKSLGESSAMVMLLSVTFLLEGAVLESIPSQ